MNVIKTIHYCKADKKTGKPVVITDKRGRRNVKKWVWKGKDLKNKPIRMEIEFNNSMGKAKASGASTVLKIYS